MTPGRDISLIAQEYGAFSGSPAYDVVKGNISIETHRYIWRVWNREHGIPESEPEPPLPPTDWRYLRPRPVNAIAAGTGPTTRGVW